MTRFNITHSKKLRWVLLCLICLAFAGVIWIYLNAGGTNKGQTADEKNKPLPSFPKALLSIGKIQHTATRNGKTEWTLEASSGQYLDENKKVAIKELTIVFFLDDNNKAQLKAEEGVLFTQTNDIQVTGNVLLENQGYQLKTEKINYNHEKRIVYSETPCTIESDLSVITSDRIKLYLIEDKTILSGNVRGILYENINE